MTFGRAILDEWPLDPAVVYLNHGTVGVTPRRVLAVQQAIRDAAERAPSQFLLREQTRLVGVPDGRPGRVRDAARLVAAFIGAQGDDVVFVDNATTGVNAVLRSLPLGPGDEVLVLDAAYGAVTHAATFATRERGARVQTVPVPMAPFDEEALVATFASAISTRTRLAIVDHITSESALIMPVAALTAVCRGRGVPVLVDGAHAPGVLPLDVPAFGADWYAANLHKWACAPRSCGFLWAHPAVQRTLHPVVISWGLDQGFTAEFDWVGTRDVSAWLAAPAGIEYLRAIGHEVLWRHNHGLAWEGAQRLAAAWGTTLPMRQSHIGFMAAVPMPPAVGADAADASRVRDALLFEHRIEVQVSAARGQLWARISAQVYNEMADVEALAAAVRAISR
jgi:isopenicillin-N epimerase